MNNKELRQKSRKNLRKNYWACIAACFLLLLLAADYTSSGSFLNEKYDFDTASADRSGQRAIYNIKGSHLGGELIDNLAEKIENDNVQQATTGVMATLANGITSTAHTLSFIADGVVKVCNKSRAGQILLSILGVLVSLIVYMFLQVQLKVGERRFFLENRTYHDTRATRIFYLYLTPKHALNVAWIMTVRVVFWLLWMCTIVGGVMKFYEYRAIAYILAENPEISRKDCFALARELTCGHKKEMFKFDLTYLGWMLLSSVSFGLLSIFYVNPYYRGGQAEFHVRLRELAKESCTEHIALLNDSQLYDHAKAIPAAAGADAAAADTTRDVYPLIPAHKKHRIHFSLTVPWERKYSLVHLGLMFFAFAMIGWCWEVIYHLVLDGFLVNRGSLWGPWIPIYGVGGVFVVALLKPLGKRPPVMAACTFVACGIIEYFTAWYFETFRHIKFWDYSTYLFNLDGRICLEGLIMFTALASLGLYVIAPRFDEMFRKWPSAVKVPLLSVLSAAFIGDFIYTQIHPHTGEGISSDALSHTDSAGTDSFYRHHG